MDAAAGGTPSRSRLRRVLAVLCVTQVVSWGVLYYAFPVVAPAISAETGWPVAVVTAAFSAGLVVSAAVGVPVGRWLDRVGPRPVMTVGSVLAVPAVLGIATARSLPWFFASWVLAGVAMAGVLYQPAFAALTRWWGPRRVTALTTLTLVAGLSSTVFAPLTAALLAGSDWRRTYLVLAVVLAATTIPAHLFGLRGRWPAPGESDVDAGDRIRPATTGDPAAIAHSREFLLLVAAVGLGTFTAFAGVINQVPLLLERGVSVSTAAWALGLGGAGQVLGRLGFAPLSRTTGVRARTVLILAAVAVSTALLAVLPGPAPALIAAAMLTGAARGVLTLLQATAISERWGAAHYGQLAGRLGVPVMLATALSPWAGAALAGPLGGYPAVFLLLAALAATAAVIAAGTVPAQATPHR